MHQTTATVSSSSSSRNCSHHQGCGWQPPLCSAAKKHELAKTQLESLDQTLQASGLGEWEPDLALEVLRLLHNCYELLPQNHAIRERKEEIHRRLCHLDLEVVLD